MSRRPLQHVTGDIAIAEVSTLLASAGWSVEKNLADYGEDIFGQTSLNELVDPYVVPIQVKAVSKDIFKTKDTFKFSVRTESLIRWVRSVNQVIFAVCTIKDRKVYYAKPSDQFTTYQLTRSKKHAHSIILHRDNLLTPTAIKRIEWIARVRNYNFMLMEYSTQSDYIDVESENDKLSKDSLQMEVIEIVCDFLSTIGVVENRSEGVIPDFSLLLETYQKNLPRKNTIENGIDLSAEAFLFASLLMRMRDVCPNVPIPGFLLENMTKVMASLLKSLFSGSEFEFTDFFIDPQQSPTS